MTDAEYFEKVQELKQWVKFKFDEALERVKILKSEYREWRTPAKQTELMNKINSDGKFAKSIIPAILYDNLGTKVEELFNDLPFMWIIPLTLLTLLN
jgi:hypothetical protein